MSEFDELAFGGGRSVQLRRDGKDTNEMFFLADQSVLVAEFNLISTVPMKLDGDDTGRVYYICTFSGRKNNEKALGAVTVVMTYEVVKALTTGLRQKMGKTPIEYRAAS